MEKQSFILKISWQFFLWLERILHPKCEKCHKGRIIHDRIEWTGKTWIDVYKCDKCNNELF